MGEIRIVSPGKTCGYPYPVCKKIMSAATGFFLLKTNKISVVNKPSVLEPLKFYCVCLFKTGRNMLITLSQQKYFTVAYSKVLLLTF